MTFIDHLNWRYATKVFDGRKVPADVVDKILEAIRLTPSSFGIQPYVITVIEDDTLKHAINTHAFWDQQQIATCSHLLVFSAETDIVRRAHEYIALAAKAGREDITSDPEFDYEKGAVEFGTKMGVEWAAKQTYLALGFALAACAELEVDSCPMEAVDFSALKTALNLRSSLEPKVLLPIGYRSAIDTHAQDNKLRLSREDLLDIRL